MAVRVCPHCHLRVFVLKDGVCPNCKCDVDDLSEVDPRKSTIVLQSSLQIPEVCILCGTPTQRTVQIAGHDAIQTAEQRADGDSLGLAALLFFLLPIPILLPESKKGTHAVRSVRLRVPQCEFCTEHQITIVSVDSLRETMTIVADREFISELRRVNG